MPARVGDKSKSRKAVASSAQQLRVAHERGEEKDEGRADLGADLVRACVAGSLTLVTSLLDKGVDLNVADACGKNSLIICCTMGNVSIAKLLVDKGAGLDIADLLGQTALHYCCQLGHVDIALNLIDQGAGLDIADSGGQTALHLACEGGHSTIVARLIAAGADRNMTANDGRTPFSMAFFKGHADIVALLAAKDEVAQGGETASGAGQDGRKKPNKKKKKNKNKKKEKPNFKEDASAEDDDFDWNLEMRDACACGDIIEVNNLLQHEEVDINHADTDGHTPLHAACLNGEAKIAKLLVEEGATLKLNDDGETALDFARRWERTDGIVKFLTETFSAAVVLIAVSSGEAGLVQEEVAGELGQIEQLDHELRTTQEQLIEAQTSLFLEAQQSQQHISDLKDELHVAQQEFQQLHAEQKEGAAITRMQILEALGEQKEILEENQMRRLEQTRVDAASALEMVRRQHQKASTRLQTDLQRQHEQTGVALREREQLKKMLEEELKAASTLAAISAVEQLPGLGDVELKELEEAMRNEITRRQQLTLEREREEMRAKMEREREELRRTMRAEMEREQEAAAECAVCLDRKKDTALNCGHQACAVCAGALARCHICRKAVTTRTKLY